VPTKLNIYIFNQGIVPSYGTFKQRPITSVIFTSDEDNENNWKSPFMYMHFQHVDNKFVDKRKHKYSKML